MILIYFKVGLTHSQSLMKIATRESTLERKGVVIGSGVCGKCGLNVLTDKQFHPCRRQWRCFPKICLDDNRGGHCFGNIGGGARGVVQGGRMAATCEPPAESQVDRLPRRLRPGATGPQRKHTNKRARSIFTAIHFFHSEPGKGVERTDPQAHVTGVEAAQH